jgi:hydrogenase maturation protease
MTPLLIIGYGNELRGDDGAGPRVAHAVAGWNRLDVRGVAVHQLTPELAPLLANHERVAFVDAAMNGPAGWRRLHPACGLAALGHMSDPGWLLALTRELYGWVPETWLATIAVANIGYDSKLTPVGEHGVQVVLRRIIALTNQAPPPRPSGRSLARA